MSMTERAIKARILNRITDEEADLVSEIDLRVRREVMCLLTGKVLDSRTALLVRAKHPQHPSYPEWFSVGVVHPSAEPEVLRRAAQSELEATLTGISPDLLSRL